MKIKVYVKYLNPSCKLTELANGDWIDLRSACKIEAKKGDYMRIPLGIAMQLPKGFEAIVNPRSSSYEKYHFSIPNSQGVIDNSYNGDQDEWKCLAKFDDKALINVGDRICQFRIQLSQKANIWAKLKWLLSSGVQFIEVNTLNNQNRGGFGSTGIK